MGKKKENKKDQDPDKVGYKKPPKSGQIKPGEVRNPLGARAHKLGRIPSATKLLTAEEVAKILAVLLRGNKKEIEKMAADPESSNIVKWYCKAAIKGMDSGDLFALEHILNRAVGRVKDVVEISGPDGSPLEISNEEKAERKKRIAEKIKKIKKIDGL